MSDCCEACGEPMVVEERELKFNLAGRKWFMNFTGPWCSSCDHVPSVVTDAIDAAAHRLGLRPSFHRDVAFVLVALVAAFATAMVIGSEVSFTAPALATFAVCSYYAGRHR